jgi:hypothetical protein
MVSTFDQQPAIDEREQNDQLIDHMSQTDGWDGEPLSDEEQMASMMGDSPEGARAGARRALLQEAGLVVKLLVILI